MYRSELNTILESSTEISKLCHKKRPFKDKLKIFEEKQISNLNFVDYESKFLISIFIYLNDY